MSRRRSKVIFGDFTLNDFANAAPSKCDRGTRIKKTFTSSIIREVKDLTISEPTALKRTTPETDLSWYDKDLDDFDICDSDEIQIFDDYDWDIPDNKRDRKANKYKSSSLENATTQTTSVHDTKCDGYEYPPHIWLLLAEYIDPDDVVRFSSICESAYRATKTARFWITLYRRYYNPQIEVPERLTPLCMERPRGLKACVVRTLFLTYPPFMERTRTKSVGGLSDIDHEFSQLLRYYCVLAWHKQGCKSQWEFLFKFQNSCPSPSRRSSSYTNTSRRLPDILEMLGDIEANEEDGCRVLKVICPHYIAVPPVMGMFMTAASSVGSTGVKITFSRNTYCQPKRYQSEDDIMITFETAIGVSVLDWWHPQYPYSTSS